MIEKRIQEFEEKIFKYFSWGTVLVGVLFFGYQIGRLMVG